MQKFCLFERGERQKIRFTQVIERHAFEKRRCLAMADGLPALLTGGNFHGYLPCKDGVKMTCRGGTAPIHYSLFQPVILTVNRESRMKTCKCNA
jgi:hypothetical protein